MVGMHLWNKGDVIIVFCPCERQSNYFLVQCFSFFLISLNISYQEFFNPFIINSHGFLILFPRNMNFEIKQSMHWAGVKAHSYITLYA